MTRFEWYNVKTNENAFLYAKKVLFCLCFVLDHGERF